MITRIAKRAGREVAYWAFRAWCAGLPSPAYEPERVRKVMVPLYAGIGNIVLYLPALAAIRRALPEAEVVGVVGTSRRNEEVVGSGGVDRVIEVRLDAPFRRRLADMRALRDERFDLCVNAFHCAFPYHAAMTAFAKIPWRCGHVSSPGWKNPYDFLYNLPAAMERDQYEADRYLELAYAVGVKRGDVSTRLFLPVSDEARWRAATLLGAREVEPDATIVAVHAGTSEIMRWKQWGLDRFEAVVRRLAEERPGAVFVLVGAPDERAEQAPMIERLGHDLGIRFVDLVGETDVPALAAVLERASLLVGNDSGPMQIAVALGVTVVVPWGPSDLPRNAPRDGRHAVVFKGLPCSPCYRMPGDSKVHLCNDRQCLAQIRVDEVAEAALVRIPAS